jgi:hypothetical protein
MMMPLIAGLEVGARLAIGQDADPVGGGGEQDPVPGLAGPDRQAGSQVRLAGTGLLDIVEDLLGL